MLTGRIYATVAAVIPLTAAAYIYPQGPQFVLGSIFAAATWAAIKPSHWGGPGNG